ncbi:unnamed protein product, partial [Closterium sp. NIES-54]
ESGHKVKVIRTDNEGEFIGADFVAVLKKKGIQHQLTVPYKPHQNGVAERFSQTLQEGARTLLGRAGLPDPFWVTALRQVALVKNRVLATVGDKQWVPYSKWYGSAPVVNMLRAYDCMVVFHGWLIWDLTSQQLTVSRDVKFPKSLYYKEWKQQKQKLPTTPLIIEDDEVQRPSRQAQVTVSEEEISRVTEDGGELEELYMLQPEGLDDGSGRVCRLKKAIYGLKQAPRTWYHKLEETLLAGGFKKSECDHSLFLLQEKEEFLMLLVYVDDILLFSESSAMIERVEEMLEMQFKCSKIGDFKYYLGMHVERDLNKGVLRLHKRKYYEGLAEKYGLQDGGKPATRLPSGFTVEPCVDEEVVGETRLVRYVSATASVSLEYSAMRQRQQWGAADLGKGEMLLTCYTDASFNSVKADGTSIGGYVCQFKGGAVSWRSKKQNEVGLSSCETEYMALHHGVKEVVWLRRLLEEIGVLIWPLAIRHATVIKNQVSTHVGGQHWVAMKKWSGKKPLVDMLRVFGCMGLVHVPKEKRDKLQAAVVWAVHLGLARGSKGWLMWDPKSNTIFTTRDAKFVEGLMFKEWSERGKSKVIIPLGIEVGTNDPLLIPIELSSSSELTEVSHDLGGAEGEATDVEGVLQQREAPVTERGDTEEEVQQPTRSSKLPPRRTAEGKHDALRGGAKEGAAKERPKRAAHPRDCWSRRRKMRRRREPRGRWSRFVALASTYHMNRRQLEEALAGDDREAWLASREDEFKSHMENEAWTLTNLPPGRKALDCTWVLRVRTDA